MRAENTADKEGLRPLWDSPERDLGNGKGLDKYKKGHGNQVREGAGDTRLRLTLTREELTLNPFLAMQP